MISITPLGPFIDVIEKIYSVSGHINDFLDDHIQSMKNSENSTIYRVGTVMEGAKLGFGMGYLSSVTIMSVGQILLGNSLAAASTVATAATLSNPIAMTCAAVGAIYFGWNALKEEDKNEILSKLEKGLNIGREMIKSIINFVLELFKKFNDSKFIAEIKIHIQNIAGCFGRNLSDVTKQTIDKIKDLSTTLTDNISTASQDLVDTAKHATGQAQEAGKNIVEKIKSGTKNLKINN
jgi:methyl-accepting chemotaxis protein